MGGVIHHIKRFQPWLEQQGWKQALTNNFKKLSQCREKLVRNFSLTTLKQFSIFKYYLVKKRLNFLA